MSELKPTRLSVIIIEPVSHMRTILRSIVHDLGVTDTRETDDVESAFEMFKERPADLIFTDWSDDVDAIQFLSLVRRADDSPDKTVPIIVVTANTDLGAVFKARDSGMTEYLAKPISANLVQARLRAAIGQPRMFVDASTFFGPDRRRCQTRVDGPERRVAKLYEGPERRHQEVPFDGPERRHDHPDFVVAEARGADR
jgi:CheY-like chemotaxis protein